MNLQEIDRKIQLLREEYKIALFDKREIIKRRARALEIAKEKILKKEVSNL